MISPLQRQSTRMNPDPFAEDVFVLYRCCQCLLGLNCLDWQLETPECRFFLAVLIYCCDKFQKKSTSLARWVVARHPDCARSSVRSPSWSYRVVGGKVPSPMKQRCWFAT